MTKSKKLLVSARKKPTQARSTEIVETILEAALRVLAKDGGAKLTTVRVAEEAGVSIGSLYQYFPNKASLLFRLQADEWNETWGVMEEIMGDDARPPSERLERAVRTFFRSERQEAALRTALDDADAPFRDSPEATALLERALASVVAFIGTLAPHVPPARRPFVARFWMTNMGAVAEEITAEGLTREELDDWARESAKMYASYFESLARS